MSLGLRSQAPEEPGAPAAGAILLRRLSAVSALPAADRDVVRGIAASLRQHPVRTLLCAEGGICPPRFVVSGWACRQRLLADGRRQIVSFLLPGDLIGPVFRPRLASSCAVVALTRVESVDGQPLLDEADDADPDADTHAGPHASLRAGPGRPAIARALHLMDRMGEVRLRDQVVRLGRQTAYERLLHLLLEFRDRLLVVGLGEHDRYPLPLTQEILADALGLSVVHLNRTLQQIRRDGLVELRSGAALLLKPHLIEAVADWQPPPEPVD